jgi:hypothetical protein
MRLVGHDVVREREHPGRLRHALDHIPELPIGEGNRECRAPVAAAANEDDR